jgi:hypothetical protein
MADNFTLMDALLLDEGFVNRLNVRVGLTNGKPDTVSFSDPDRGTSVSVPYDLWARTVAAVARAVDMGSVS